MKHLCHLALIFLAVASQARADNEDCVSGVVLKIRPEPDGTIALYDEAGNKKEPRVSPPEPQKASGARVIACGKTQKGRLLYKIRIGSDELWLAARNVDLVPPPREVCVRTSREPATDVGSRNVHCIP